MPDDDSYVIGLDMGTGGARAIAVDFQGRIVAETRANLSADATAVSGARVEQDPQGWTRAAQDALARLTSRITAGFRPAGIAVDATSGTFVLVDRDTQPLTPGIMYNDQRAVEVTDAVAEALQAELAPFGIRIAPSFALPKIVHLMRNSPDLFARCHRIVHQTDWIVGWLCGRYDITDISTALKTGADPRQLAWPTSIERLGVPRRLLPRIVLPGTPIGRVTTETETVTGIPAGTPVIAGCTDGTAGCLASGAGQPGDLNVTLGTTLVFKAISPQPILDPEGALYNHRHPAGGYLPGAASSTGGDWIEEHFRDVDLHALSSEAQRLLPTRKVVYPLMKAGERFPFCHARAAGFGLEQIHDPATKLAAGMEAVAFLERMAIERFAELGLPIGPTIFATGGGAANDTWLRIRASVNRRSYAVPENASCSIGAAVLAAMPVLGGCRNAIERIVRSGRRIEPVDALCGEYEDAFGQFRDALIARGYVSR
jgi:sugar (pentulose or hexulose) kinase